MEEDIQLLYDTAMNTVNFDDLEELEGKVESHKKTNSENINSYTNNTHLDISDTEKDDTKLSQLRGKSVELANEIECLNDRLRMLINPINKVHVEKQKIETRLRRAKNILEARHCLENVAKAFSEEDYEYAATIIHKFNQMDREMLSISATLMEDYADEQTFDQMKSFSGKIQEIILNKLDELLKTHQNGGNNAVMCHHLRTLGLLSLQNTAIDKYSFYVSTRLLEEFKNIGEAGGREDYRESVKYADQACLFLETSAKILEDSLQLFVQSDFYSVDGGYLMRLIEVVQPTCDAVMENLFKTLQNGRKMSEHVLPGKSTQRRNDKNSNFERENVDLRLTNIISTELSLILKRSNLYFKFCEMLINTEMAHCRDESVRRAIRSRYSALKTKSGLFVLMAEVVNHIVTLDGVYLGSVAEKFIPFKMAEGVFDGLDEIFYVVRKCFQRISLAGSVEGTCALINKACGLLDESLVGGLVAFMDNLGEGVYSGIVLDAGDYVALLNSTAVCFDHISQLRREISECPLFAQQTDHMRELVDSSCDELGLLVSQFGALRDRGFDVFRRHLVVAGVKSLIGMSFAFSVSTADLRSLGDYEVDSNISELCLFIEEGISRYKNVFLAGNFDIFLDVFVKEFVHMLEKAVFRTCFDINRAILAEREVRAMANLVISASNWVFREQFTRLLQILLILSTANLNEVVMLWRNSHFEWLLSVVEVRQVLCLRSEFSRSKIMTMEF